jgi:hypothetical protein
MRTHRLFRAGSSGSCIHETTRAPYDLKELPLRTAIKPWVVPARNRWKSSRLAETRAVNRALRKAYGIGLCSVEELGWLTGSPDPPREQKQSIRPPNPNGSSNGQPRLRDRLCVLIRQYNLDPILVKAYAADFCGTPTLKDATRELVESFIFHLAASVKENRDGLLCKLNSYAQPVEVKL